MAFRRGCGELDLSRFAFLLEDFLVCKFKLEGEVAKRREKWGILEKIYHVKRNFVQRVVYFKYRASPVLESSFNFVSEEDFAARVLAGQGLEELEKYASFALFSPRGRLKHRDGTLFKMPCSHGLEYTVRGGEVKAEAVGLGALTQESAFWHARYCIHCHKTGKDSCRKGDASGNAGCPLGQKISEMAQAKAEGGVIAPLAIAMVDNPLILLTGMRICNDCKLACIFKKQEAVEVPGLESAILEEVLALASGFEVYCLLTRWNPMKREGFLPKPSNGRRVLVCGAGPAGVAASYYFLREGFDVTCIEGLQIKPLGFDFTRQIKDVASILEGTSLGDAFGGVMRYGIPPRWNKNFLTLARIVLERQKGFRLYGGVRFGSSITWQQAQGLGFCYIAFCTGSGKPNVPDFAPYIGREGIFTASDFLMQVNTTGRFNGAIKAPVLVIGGGLTALDAASRALALTGGEVFVLYRKEAATSPAFRQNEDEVRFALGEGIRYLENKNPLRIDGKTIFFEDGSKMQFGTLIFATGINTGEKPEAWQKEGFMVGCTPYGFYGDLAPGYHGSVVKAIASVKDGYESVCRALLARPAPALQEADFESTVVCCRPDRGVLKLTVHSALQAANSRVLDLFKLKLGGHSIPLTLFAVKGGELTFFIKVKGETTMQAAGLKKGEKICLMRAKNEGLRPEFDLIITDDNDFIAPLSLVCKNTILCQNIDTSYEVAENALLYLTKGGALPQVKARNLYLFNFTQMNCMLGGVCSRCLKLENGKQIYECAGNIRPLLA